MVIILVLYAGLVYLLVFKFKLIPRNAVTRVIIVFLGIAIAMSFMAGLRVLTPASTLAGINGQMVEIAPQVSGRVVEVHVERNIIVPSGAKLFTIDPTHFQAIVDNYKANLDLSQLRTGQFKELASKDAGSQFQYQQSQAETLSLEANLAAAQFDLDNTVVRAPFEGLIPSLYLKEGMQVSPQKSVMAFVDTSNLYIGGLFQQKALDTVKVGDKARVNFPALPGRVFETRVIWIPSAIGDGQLVAAGQLPKVESRVNTRKYPIYVEMPDDFPDHLRKIGVSAQIYIFTENAGIVGPVAMATQWINTSLDIIR